MKSYNFRECAKVESDLLHLQQMALRMQSWFAKHDSDFSDNYVYQQLDSIIALCDDANQHVYLM